jgi:hypothetical protein
VLPDFAAQRSAILFLVSTNIFPLRSKLIGVVLLLKIFFNTLAHKKGENTPRLGRLIIDFKISPCVHLFFTHPLFDVKAWKNASNISTSYILLPENSIVVGSI